MDELLTTLVGDCREILPELKAESVHCCVTSPPYYGLRDYGHAGQIGQEETPEAFVSALVDVFREVRRVLRDDGTLWLNLGDSYATKGGASVPQSGAEFAGRRRGNETVCRSKRLARGAGRWGGGNNPATGDLKEKDLIGIPWMVAFALRADGWYLRQDIIWHKPNPMPESVEDRCTKSHEYVFLLSKSPRYYFDYKAIQEPAARPEGPGNKSSYVIPGPLAGDNANLGGSVHKIGPREMRNKRDVWTVTLSPYKEAHFATFPPDLIRPCILAGCPVGGVVLDPFGGSGTTGKVALELGRRAMLCELNPSYVEMIDSRTTTTLGFGW